jgi:hypothetical protein
MSQAPVSESHLAALSWQAAPQADRHWEYEMQLYMSEGKVSRRARRWAWANRPAESIDNPVKKYLRNRDNWPGLKEWQRAVVERARLRPRPAV